MSALNAVALNTFSIANLFSDEIALTIAVLNYPMIITLQAIHSATLHQKMTWDKQELWHLHHNPCFSFVIPGANLLRNVLPELMDVKKD